MFHQRYLSQLLHIICHQGASGCSTAVDSLVLYSEKEQGDCVLIILQFLGLSGGTAPSQAVSSCLSHGNFIQDNIAIDRSIVNDSVCRNTDEKMKGHQY